MKQGIVQWLMVVGMIIVMILVMVSANVTFGQNSGWLIVGVPPSFLNASGLAAASARLCTTTTGTSTSLATYSDAALGSVLPNPIVLNSVGIPTTNGTTQTSVYGQPGYSYRITLYANGTGNTCNGTAVGTQIWQRDGIYNPASLNQFDNVRICDRFAGANAGAKIIACLADLPAGGGVADARGFEGAQTATSTITIPSRGTLMLGATTLTSATSPAIAVTVTAAGLSGRVVGIGPQTILNYTGSGHAINILGASGESSSMVEVSDMSIAGTSSGLSGLHLRSFNNGLFKNLQISGFTTGSGIYNEGANNITFRDVTSRGNLYGIRNVGVVVGGTNYAANAVQFDGGHLINNTGWGVLEDGTQSVTVGPNYSNVYRTTIELNGVNASTTTGNVFIQQCNSCKVVDSYLEYGGAIIPTQNVVVGDATYAPTSTVIMNNAFISGTAVTSISNTNGMSTMVANNIETGAVTNFMLNGTGSRGLTMMRNRAAAATNLFNGSDGGSDSVIMETTAYTGTNFNGMAATTTGFGFNTLRGLNQDLVIRLRSGGTNILTLDAADGTDRVLFLENGMMTQGGVAFASIGTPSDGTIGYCSNCQVTSGADNTCATGGTGALAVRLNGVWRCFAAQN